MYILNPIETRAVTIKCDLIPLPEILTEISILYKDRHIDGNMDRHTDRQTDKLIPVRP